MFELRSGLEPRSQKINHGVAVQPSQNIARRVQK